MMECAAQLENLLNWSTVPHTSLGFLQHSKTEKGNFLGIVQVMAEKATQELAAMEKRAVMAESMLEATLNSESGVGNTHSARLGIDPLKGNMTKSIARSHSSPSSKYFSFLPLKGQLQFVAASRKDGC
jgi:hypothetical protein